MDDTCLRRFGIFTILHMRNLMFIKSRSVSWWKISSSVDLYDMSFIRGVNWMHHIRYTILHMKPHSACIKSDTMFLMRSVPDTISVACFFYRKLLSSRRSHLANSSIIIRFLTSKVAPFHITSPEKKVRHDRSAEGLRIKEAEVGQTLYQLFN